MTGSSETKNQTYSISFRDSSGTDVEFFCSSCLKNFWCMFKAKKPKTKKKRGVFDRKTCYKNFFFKKIKKNSTSIPDKSIYEEVYKISGRLVD